jgi:hypothetical protein
VRKIKILRKIPITDLKTSLIVSAQVVLYPVKMDGSTNQTDQFQQINLAG